MEAENPLSFSCGYLLKSREIMRTILINFYERQTTFRYFTVNMRANSRVF
jgi:hypothetical protein